MAHHKACTGGANESNGKRRGQWKTGTINACLTTILVWKTVLNFLPGMTLGSLGIWQQQKEKKRKEKTHTHIVIVLNSERGIKAIILTRIYLTPQLRFPENCYEAIMLPSASPTSIFFFSKAVHAIVPREAFLPAYVVSGKRGKLKEGYFAAPLVSESVHSCYKYATRATSGKRVSLVIKSLPFICKRNIFLIAFPLRFAIPSS